MYGLGANLTRADVTGADLISAILAVPGEPARNPIWSDTTCPNGVVQSTQCAPL